MLNDWCWEKISDNCWWIKDNDVLHVATLAYHDPVWICHFTNEGIGSSVQMEGIKSAEEARWQATIWIGKMASNYLDW